MTKLKNSQISTRLCLLSPIFKLKPRVSCFILLNISIIEKSYILQDKKMQIFYW